MAEAKRVKTSVMRATLLKLGFVPYRTEDGFPAFDHEKSDTFHVFPKGSPRTLGPLRVWAIRYITIGRGAATERAYERAFAEAEVEAKANRQRKPAKPATLRRRQTATASVA